MKPAAFLLADRISAGIASRPVGDRLAMINGTEIEETKPNFPVEGERGGPAGVGMLIVCQDSEGREKTRRITVSAIQVRNEAPPLVMAHCRERDKPRTFTLNKIISVIDFNGHAFDPQTVFKDLFGLTAEELQANQPIDAAWSKNRAALAPAAHILAALAICHGSMGDDEMEIAVRYCARIAPELDSQEGLVRIAAFVQRIRPNGNTIAYYIEKLKEKPMSDRRLFMNSALDMVKSDGVIRCGDLEMMRALSLELTGVDI